MLILYLSNRYVRVIDGEVTGGRISVRNVYEEEDWSGCILNGTITDEDLFVSFLEKIWAKHHIASRNIHLVLDTTQFNLKILDIPIMKPKKIEEYIQREMSEIGRISNSVYQYFPIGEPDKEKKQMSVFALEAEEDFLREYIELFSKAGFIVESVQSARGAAILILQFMGLISEGNGIVQLVDHMVLMNFLIAEGKIIYSNRVRLFSDPGTLDYAMEISHSVNMILQFAHTQELQETVSEVVIGGLSARDYQMYIEVLEEIQGGLEVSLLERGKNIRFATQIETKFHFCAVAVGGLLKGKERKDPLMMKVMGVSQEKKDGITRKQVLPIAAVGLVLLGATVFFTGRILYLNAKLSRAKEFNTRADVVAACQQYDEAEQERNDSLTFGNIMEELSKRILDYPRVDSRTEQIVAACAVNNMVEVEISSYDAEDGILCFDTSADQVERIHRFADELSRRDIFDSVFYTGYAQKSAGTWQIKVSCRMADRQEDDNEIDADAER